MMDPEQSLAACLCSSTEPECRNGPGWGFVSPRHLSHGILRDKSRPFLLPRVPKKRPLLARLGPDSCSWEEAEQNTPKDSPKVKSAARAPRGWTLEPGC